MSVDTKEYGLNGQYFSDVRDFYHFFRSALNEQGILSTNGMTVTTTEGNPATGTPATGIIAFTSPNGRKLVEVNVYLFRTRIEEFFADYHFNNAVVRNVGDVSKSALERVIAAVHTEQTRRSKRGS